MTPILKSWLRRSVLALGIALLNACSGLTPDEQQAKRAELDAMGEKTIATLMETHAGTREVLDQSLGYVVIEMTVTKIPVFGAGGGLGVVVDRRSGTHSYVKVTRFEVGGGLGAQKYKVIIFFDDEKLLKRVISGAWHFEAGAEAGAGSTSAEGKVSTSEKGYRAYKIVEDGAIATVTVRAAYAEPYLN